MQKPNFLFLIADDHRYSAINALGMEKVKTPTLDRLMAEGTSLTHTHIMGSTSGAVCMPSRAMLHTGRGLFHTPNPIPDDTPLLPELLWQGGYTTFATGKWHNHVETFARSFNTGGKVFFGGMSDDQNAVPVYDFDPSRAYDENMLHIGKEFSTTLFADQAVTFLENRSPDDDPFFAYVSFTSPHDPRTAPSEYATMYKPDEIELPPNFMKEHPFDSGVRQVRDELLAASPRDEDEIRQHIADYYGMITHMDAEIGRILQALDDAGLRENTIVIYTADHGISIGQHGLMGKQNLYDHSMRVPLILRGSGIQAGYHSDALCYLYDLFPTLCERASIAIPETNEGYSLNALLSGQTTQHRRSIFSAYQPVFGHPNEYPYQRMVRGKRFKLIESYNDGENHSQLFDMHNDPYETTNLIGVRSYVHVVQRLGKQLGHWQKLVDDPLMMQ